MYGEALIRACGKSVKVLMRLNCCKCKYFEEETVGGKTALKICQEKGGFHGKEYPKCPNCEIRLQVAYMEVKTNIKRALPVKINIHNCPHRGGYVHRNGEAYGLPVPCRE
jgi:hypothetical protein